MIRSCTYTHTKMHISLNLLLPILLLLTTSAHAQIAGSDSADLYTRVNTYKTQAVSITNTPFDTVLNSIISSLLGWFEPISPSALTSSWVSTNTPTMSLSVQGSLLENVDMGSDFISKPLKYVHLSGDTTLREYRDAFFSISNCQDLALLIKLFYYRIHHVVHFVFNGRNIHIRHIPNLD